MISRTFQLGPAADERYHVHVGFFWRSVFRRPYYHHVAHPWAITIRCAGFWIGLTRYNIIKETGPFSKV